MTHMAQLGPKFLAALETPEVSECLRRHREERTVKSRHDLVGALIRAGIPRRQLTSARITELLSSRRWAGAGNFADELAGRA